MDEDCYDCPACEGDCRSCSISPAGEQWDLDKALESVGKSLTRVRGERDALRKQVAQLSAQNF